jgi:hypothetical protein
VRAIAEAPLGSSDIAERSGIDRHGFFGLAAMDRESSRRRVMVTKKLFALASVSALAGLMTTVAAAGCSSTTTETTTSDGGASDAKASDAKAKPDVGDTEEDTPADCPQNVALTEADLDKEIGWKPAKTAPGACSQGDITKLEANFKDTNIKTYFDLGNGLGADCKACVFSKDTDANWGPIVGTAENNGETGFINFGACFGAIEGDACGKALQYEQFCYNVACNECTTTQTERTKCIQAAGDGMCKDFGDKTGTACPKIQDTAKTCNTIFDSVKSLCGTPGDGGTDGGA